MFFRLLPALLLAACTSSSPPPQVERVSSLSAQMGTSAESLGLNSTSAKRTKSGPMDYCRIEAEGYTYFFIASSSQGSCNRLTNAETSFRGDWEQSAEFMRSEWGEPTLESGLYMLWEQYPHTLLLTMDNGVIFISSAYAEVELLKADLPGSL